MAFAIAFLMPSVAYAELRMKWDCYLPNSGVDCVVLESGLTSKIPFLTRVSDEKDADVNVTLSSIPAEGGTRFKLDFVGRASDGYATEVHTSDRIPRTIDRATATVRLMTKLERGLDDFMDQKTPATAKDGILSLEVGDPIAPPYTGRPVQRDTRWYVAPTVGTYFSDVQGVGVNASGNASLAFNDSEPRWRAQQWIGANYNRMSQPIPGTEGSASISFTGASASSVLSRAITHDNHWSAGLLLAAEKNPQANYRGRANGSAGIEFDLVPWQTVNQKNFGMRCGLGPELQRYDATNIEGRTGQVVARQFCDVFVSWHFEAVDLWAGIGETLLLKSVDYRSVSTSLSATWRLTDDITITPSVSVQQIAKAVNEAAPTSATYADAREEIEASMLASVRQGYTAPFGVQSGLSIRYVFGNGSLATEDQRWKDASSLR